MSISKRTAVQRQIVIPLQIEETTPECHQFLMLGKRSTVNSIWTVVHTFSSCDFSCKPEKVNYSAECKQTPPWLASVTAAGIKLFTQWDDRLPKATQDFGFICPTVLSSPCSVNINRPNAKIQQSQVFQSGSDQRRQTVLVITP